MELLGLPDSLEGGPVVSWTLRQVAQLSQRDRGEFKYSSVVGAPFCSLGFGPFDPEFEFSGDVQLHAEVLHGRHITFKAYSNLFHGQVLAHGAPDQAATDALPVAPQGRHPAAFRCPDLHTTLVRPTARNPSDVPIVQYVHWF